MPYALYSFEKRRSPRVSRFLRLVNDITARADEADGAGWATTLRAFSTLRHRACALLPGTSWLRHDTSLSGRVFALLFRDVLAVASHILEEPCSFRSERLQGVDVL